MARWTYAFSNGSYNDWHRKYDGIAMICPLYPSDAADEEESEAIES